MKLLSTTTTTTRTAFLPAFLFLALLTTMTGVVQGKAASSDEDGKCKICSDIANHIRYRLLATEDIKDNAKRFLKVMEGVCGTNSKECPDMLSETFEDLNKWFMDGRLKGVPVEEIVCPSSKCCGSSSCTAADKVDDAEAAVDKSDEIEIEIEDESEKSPPPPPSKSKKIISQQTMKRVSPIKSLLNYLPTIKIAGLLPASPPFFLRPLTDFVQRIMANFSRSIQLGKEMFSELIPLAREGDLKLLFRHLSSKAFWERYWRVIMGMIGFVYLVYGIFESIYLMIFPSAAGSGSNGATGNKKTPARRTVSRKSSSTANATTTTPASASGAVRAASPRSARSKGN